MIFEVSVFVNCIIITPDVAVSVCWMYHSSVLLFKAVLLIICVYWEFDRCDSW